jgi:hypothetical protein
MDDVSRKGDTIWNLQAHHFDVRDELFNPAALVAFLRVVVVRAALPLALVAIMSPNPARMVQEGARLRAWLPAYLEQRWALLDAHCAVLLPPLRALVHGCMELTTSEELWATGLGVDL